MSNFAHVDDISGWVARLRALTPAEWQRVAHAVNDQRGESIAAVWRRAAHRRLWLASITPRFGFVAQLAAAASHLAGEFSGPRDRANDVRRLRDYATQRDSPLARSLADVAEVAQAALPNDDIAQEATLIAGQALARRRVMAPNLFDVAYAPMREVVPLPESGNESTGDVASS